MFRDHSRHVRLNVKEPDEDDDPTFQLKSGNKVLELLVERVYKKRLFYVCLVSTLLFAGIVALRLTVSTDKLDRFMNEHGQIVIHKNIPLTRDQMFRRHFSRYYGNRRGYYRYHGQRIDDIFSSTVVTEDTVTEKTVTKTTTADSEVTVSDVNVTVNNVTNNVYNTSHSLTNVTMKISSMDNNVSTKRVNSVNVSNSSPIDQTVTTTDSITANSTISFLSTPEPNQNVSLPSNRTESMATSEISNVTMESPVNTTTMSRKDYFINPDLNINSSLSYANNQMKKKMFIPMATKSPPMEINKSYRSTTTETSNANGETTLGTERTALDNPDGSMTSSRDGDVNSGAIT